MTESENGLAGKAMKADVGVVGLGIMGSAMAKNLLAAGHSVAGYDPDDSALDAHRAAGGIAETSAGEVAPVILLSLPSSAALKAVVADIAKSGATDCVLVELSTLTIDDKCAARDAEAVKRVLGNRTPKGGRGES